MFHLYWFENILQEVSLTSLGYLWKIQYRKQNKAPKKQLKSSDKQIKNVNYIQAESLTCSKSGARQYLDSWENQK